MSATTNLFDAVMALERSWPRGSFRRRVFPQEVEALVDAAEAVLAEPPPAPRSATCVAPVPTDWPIEPNVLSVVCPDCAFTYDAAHVDMGTDDYSCPACAENALTAKVETLESLLVRFRKGHLPRHHSDRQWWTAGQVVIDPLTPAQAEYLANHPLERR